MKKVLIVLAVLAILGGGTYIYLQTAKVPKDQTESKQQSQNTNTDQSADVASSSDAATDPQNSQPAPENQAAAAPSQPQAKPTTGTYSSGEEESVGPDVQVWAVEFNGQSFTPDTLEVRLGDIVIFKNKSNGNFWPVSSSYLDFDAGKAIAAGGRFQFQFTKAGQIKYYDKLNSAVTGVVNVIK